MVLWSEALPQAVAQRQPQELRSLLEERRQPQWLRSPLGERRQPQGLRSPLGERRQPQGSAQSTGGVAPAPPETEAAVCRECRDSAIWGQCRANAAAKAQLQGLLTRLDPLGRRQGHGPRAIGAGRRGGVLHGNPAQVRLRFSRRCGSWW